MMIRKQFEESSEADVLTRVKKANVVLVSWEESR